MLHTWNIRMLHHHQTCCTAESWDSSLKNSRLERENQRTGGIEHEYYEKK